MISLLTFSVLSYVSSVSYVWSGRSCACVIPKRAKPWKWMPISSRCSPSQTLLFTTAATSSWSTWITKALELKTLLPTSRPPDPARLTSRCVCEDQGLDQTVSVSHLEVSDWWPVFPIADAGQIKGECAVSSLVLDSAATLNQIF